MKQRLIILMLLLGVFSLASAQENKKGEKKETQATSILIYTQVKDHLTHEPVQNVKAELLMEADSSFVDSIPTYSGEESSGLTYFLEKENTGKYLIRIHADGYVTKYAPLNASKLSKRQYMALPHVYMRKQPRKNERELDEVVVKATKLKFYMDGDTLVYDADVFPMAEGSMLGDLLKRMPGVQVEDGGVIRVNGRKVDVMLLNGKNFFDKDREMLLENMPSYMVKSFNAYERIPYAVKGTVWEKNAPRQYVADVRLKKEYSIGWISNAEAGGGATFFDNANGNKDGKYLGRLFGLRFTKNSRLTAFVNANNLNAYRKPGKEGDWEQLSQSGGLTSAVKGGINYLYDQGEGLPKSLRYEGSVDGAYNDMDDQLHMSRATFLDYGNTFGKSFSARRNYSTSVNTAHNLFYRQREVKELFQNLSIHLQPRLLYGTWNRISSSASATLAEDVASRLGKAWMDSIIAPNAGDLLKRYAINRTRTSGKNLGHQLDAACSMSLACDPASNDYIFFNLDIYGSINDTYSDNYEHYTIDYPRDNTQKTDYRNSFDPTKDKRRSLSITPSIGFALDHNAHHKLTLQHRYTYSHQDRNHPLYLLNRLEGWEQPDSHPLGMLPSMEEMLTTMDWNNSLRSVQTDHTQSPEIVYRYGGYKNGRYRSIDASVRMNFKHEQLDFQQGTQIDTLMRRNTALPAAYISYYHSAKTKSINASYDFDIFEPPMNNILNIRDDRDPLNVRFGNPDLRNSIRHSARFEYREQLSKSLFFVIADGNLTANDVAYGFIYDKETGARMTKPQNVSGNWRANIHSSINFPLDKNDKWRMEETVKYSYNHSVDLAGTNEMMEATRSVVGSHYITDEFSLKYRPNYKMEYGVNGSLIYQNSTGNRESFETINAFTFHYGANAQIELPWGVQFSTDLTMYSRRGYSERSMNINELVWNARVAKRLMNGNMTLMFDGFDLLGNLSNVYRSINAQGRTEMFFNVIPSYGLFHVIYRLNKQPKKKE